MTPDQRDILLIPVPFTDLSSTKRRPVLVLSTLEHNASSPDIIVAAITSNLTTAGGGLKIVPSDMDAGTLPTTSLIRPDKVYTLSKGIVIKRYGRLNKERFDQATTRLGQIVGLPATYADDGSEREID